jgi:hypothetical protein
VVDKKKKQIRDLGVRDCWVRDFGVGVARVPFVLTGLRGRAWGVLTIVKYLIQWCQSLHFIRRTIHPQ